MYEQILAKADQQPEQLFATELLEEVVDTFEDFAREHDASIADFRKDLIYETDRCFQDWLLLPEVRGAARFRSPENPLTGDMVSTKDAWDDDLEKPCEAFVGAIIENANDLFAENAEDEPFVIEDDGYEDVSLALERILSRWLS